MQPLVGDESVLAAAARRRRAVTGLVLFDLDGTLIDPRLGLTESYAHTCAELGLEMLPPDRLVALIGPPLQEALALGWGLDEPARADAARIFRAHHGAGALLKYEVYEGAGDLLRRLAVWARLAIATSKPEPYAIEIARREGWDGVLVAVAGASLDGSGRHKDEVIDAVLQVRPERPVVMVGDRAADVAGAAAHGIPTVGVAWGYGAEAELLEAGAVVVVATPAEVDDAVARLLSR